MTADQTKLLPMKPCPFCGGEPHMHNAMGEWWVHCIGCGAGPSMSNTSAEAIAAWNRRAQPHFRSNGPFLYDDEGRMWLQVPADKQVDSRSDERRAQPQGREGVVGEVLGEWESVSGETIIKIGFRKVSRACESIKEGSKVRVKLEQEGQP